MPSTTSELTSEFIGTYLLILTIGCSVLSGAGLNAGVAISAALMVSIYALGGVSGAHFNPAVTVAIFLNSKDEKDPAKQFGISKLGMYVATQLVAASFAGFTFSTIFNESINVAPQGEYGWSAALAGEFLYTWLLVFIVLRCAVNAPAGCEYFGLCIGFVILAGAYAAGPISGGCFNPAVAFGLDITSTSKGFHGCIWYSLVEIAASCLAWGCHQFFLPNKDAETSTGKKLFSEFLGTFILVLTVGLNVLTTSPAGALSIGASLMIMVYALGGVSGAHFNPAVTVATALVGFSEWKDAPGYIAAQLGGAIAAGITYTSMVGKAFPLAPGTGYSWADCAFAEIIFTFVLCFVVLNAACSSLTQKREANMYGLCVGASIWAGGNAIGMISGGSLNPAVSVGIDFAYLLKGGTFLNSIAYTGFEVIGASLAAFAFKVVRPLEVQAK